MNRFAELLDRLSFEPSRNNKLRLMTDYFRTTPDPERGYALAALTSALGFQHAKPGLIRALISERVDPTLFYMSYDYVGDLSETVALLWPEPASMAAGAGHNRPPLALSEVVTTLATSGKLDLPRILARWLDALDEIGRWALLKLITGSLRVGVSARLAKTAVGDIGGKEPNEIEEVWHGLAPPYIDLFAWVEGREGRPEARDPGPFRPPMLAHPIEEPDLAALNPEDFSAEWKWDGIRMQVVAGHDAKGKRVLRMFSRTGEENTHAFPDLAEVLAHLPAQDFAIDGELLILREHRVQPFSVLQQRLNRKTVSAKHMADFPAHVRAYDLLSLDGEDLRPLAFCDRRKRLEGFVADSNEPRLDLSPIVRFKTLAELAAAPAAQRLGKGPPPAGQAPPAPAQKPMPPQSKESCSSVSIRSTCPGARK